MKNKKRKSIILCILILSVVLAACASDEAGGNFDSVEAAYDQVYETSGGGNGYLSSVPPAAGRLVIMNADMTIEVEDPAEMMALITQMALTYRGYVVSSDLHQRTGVHGTEVPYAEIMIRVPADKLVQIMEEIESQAISVKSKNQSGQDITKEYTDLKSRLRNLEDAAEQLRQIMDTTGNTNDVLAVYRELTQVTEQIEVIQGQIQYYDESVAFSAISVTLSTYEEEKEISIGGWQPGGVAKDAIQTLINTLQVIVNILIWLVIFGLPFLISVLLIYLAMYWVKNNLQKVLNKFLKKG